jgi:uncharacterized repeat protein (TIGR03803 family)
MWRNKFSGIILGIFAIVAGTSLLVSGAAASTFKVLHVFNSASAPNGNLVFDAAGNLYGTTSAGGTYGYGIVFKLRHDPDGTWRARALYNFTGGKDGGNPYAGLIFDSAGNLYGTTVTGGNVSSGGVVFKLKPNANGTWTESVVHTFVDDGEWPYAGLVFDAAGNLYGTAAFGGDWGCGTVFMLKPNPDGTWTDSKLYGFTCNADGGFPYGALIFDAAGSLYGTGQSADESYGWGSAVNGVVFEVSPNSDGTWTESTLYKFSGGADGRWPSAQLIFDGAGNLYGTTFAGGAYGYGVVFKLTGGTEEVLHSFTGRRDGGIPYAGLTFDGAGNLYGTTYAGGAYGYGVVFKLTPDSNGWKETVLHGFLGDGANPYAGLIMDPAGNLYGTASSGKNNGGLVFEITP